ncbi:MAG TPA: multiheme c-type cytochrome, partial [Polyangia bacterium]|nr:multiheme c-type cytochrome [Polyangia bacterium]
MSPLPRRNSWAFALLLAGAAVTAARAAAPAGERRLTIFYTAEVHGAIEPCGCTSDPLGDVSRFATLVGAARKESGAVLLVDAGGLLYAESGSSARERPADDARAAFLAATVGKLGFVGVGLADSDLTAGLAAVHPQRLASNFAPSTVVRAPAVHTVGTGTGAVKVGVLGIADPALADRLGAPSEDVARAARRDADRLRQQGAELVVLLAPVEKGLARRVAREAAVDLVVLGRQVGAGLARAERVTRGNGDPSSDGPAAFLLAPADELQRVGRADLVLRAGAPPALRDAGGPAAVRLRQDEIERALKQLDADIARWDATGAAAENDAAFVAARKQERASLIAERAALAAPWTAPREGSYFTNRLIPVRRSLPRDPALVAGMKALDLRIAAINRRNPQPPPPAEPGRASFAGVAACVKCHAPAVEQWKKTMHAAAWRTLANGKQADYKCIGCHLTGYGQVGGSTLGFTKGLEAVQCESCHGPASLHVAAGGLEEPSSVHRLVPETTCSQCHNPHHSDTFQYQAYLRDILGPGHGGQARKKLGDGPTGHGLRAAAVAKA